ncbi:hypothetical protein ILYODFUR_010169 [Ilyodon furcidens]|uniref:Uncharacterized protein n=1 Tax=Ilyodon furcidens TaxID=33524 RepID=A0ABV0V4E0_9TELE
MDSQDVSECSLGCMELQTKYKGRIDTNDIHLVLLSTQQFRYLAGGAAGVARPLVTNCIFSHCHVGH